MSSCYCYYPEYYGLETKRTSNPLPGWRRFIIQRDETGVPSAPIPVNTTYFRASLSFELNGVEYTTETVMGTAPSTVIYYPENGKNVKLVINYGYLYRSQQVIAVSDPTQDTCIVVKTTGIEQCATAVNLPSR